MAITIFFISIRPILRSRGSIINGSFQRADVIDELSLVVAPIVADKDDKPLFMDSTILNFKLNKAETISGNLVLNYKRNNNSVK